MKKIVGILSAAAVLATSVFAADVSAKVNIIGSLFNWQKDGNLKVLGIAEGGQSWNPSFQMAYADDRSGASMKFYDNKGQDGQVSSVNYSLWFKPIEMLKFTVGNWATNLNQETIDYSNTETGIDASGFAASLDISGFTVDLFLVTGWSDSNFGWNRNGNIKPWLQKNADDDLRIGQTYLKLGYAADFGTINGFFEYRPWNPAENSWSGPGIGIGEYNAFKFGVGYKNTIADVTFFVNALGGITDSEFSNIRAEAFASTNINGLGLAVFVPFDFALADNSGAFYTGDHFTKALTKNTAVLGTSLKVTYGIDAINLYCYVKETNFLADKFSIEIKPGFTTNIGAASIDVAVDLYVQERFNVDVPVVFTLSF